jgi:outer membrane protein insertion porin family
MRTLQVSRLVQTLSGSGNISKFLQMIIYICLTLAFSARASDLSSSKIKVSCNNSTRCENLKEQLKDLIKLKGSDPQRLVKLLLRDGKVISPYFVVHKEELRLHVKFKPLIQNISIKIDKKINLEVVEKSLRVNVGEVFDQSKLLKMKKLIIKYMADIGYLNTSLSYKLITENDNVAIKITLIAGKPSLLKKVSIISTHPWVKKYFSNRLLRIINKPYNFNNVKKTIDAIRDSLRKYGYYLLSYELTDNNNNNNNNNNINIVLKIINSKQYVFDVPDNRIIDKRISNKLIKEIFDKFKYSVDDSKFIEGFSKYYSDKGYLNAQVSLKKKEYKNTFKVDTIHRKIKVKLNRRTKVRGIFFKGNFFFPEIGLRKVYLEDSFDLASINIFDPIYHDFFKNKLRRRYIKEGFVQIDIGKTNYIFSKSKEFVDIVFNIKEGVRTFVSSIKLQGVPLSYQANLLKHMSTKLDMAFDPLLFEEDLFALLSQVKNLGHFNTKILNTKSDTIVKYSPDYSSVEILIDFEIGKQIRLKNSYFVGNQKTRLKLLNKEVDLKPGDLITPDKLKEIRSKLNSLGLFKSVSVRPLIGESISTSTDLLISVEEKPFTVFEIAPGFRTDLGAKISLKADFLNLWKRNHTFSLKSQFNKRISNTAFDPTRSQQDVIHLESSHKASYLSPNIFETKIHNSFALSYQEKRFYSFDARISKIGDTISTDITDKSGMSLRYQLEKIQQYDATDALDEGKFEVGTLTPSVFIDRRDQRINARKGSFHNLSVEYASPGLARDTEINYYKVFSRNNFYLPINNWVMAFYLSLGYQNNLAEQSSSIPDIKSFRLTGSDTVRGFEFSEINRLKNGSPLAETEFNDQAYLINMKFEPRYYINDTMIIGMFYDAGRIFLTKPDPTDLRSSIGITFKYLTPVGSLDFDYGFKTLRKKNPDGILESPGRLHVSIGFF